MRDGGYFYLQNNNTWYMSDKKYPHLDGAGQEVEIFSTSTGGKLYVELDDGLEITLQRIPEVQIEILRTFGQWKKT